MKKRSKVLEAVKRERHGGSACDAAIHFVDWKRGGTHGGVCPGAPGRQRGRRYFAVSRVNISLKWRRKAGGRWVVLSGTAVIASRCIRQFGLRKEKTRASARKWVDPGD